MNNYFFTYGIIGSSGKLGSEVKSALSNNGGTIVFYHNRTGHFEITTPEILIDCSSPDAFEKTIYYAGKFKVPLVIATTGLSEEQFDSLKILSESVPVIQSNNYSTGIQVLLNLINYAKNYLPDWDVEIEETHHRSKKDKPSGTAKMIQNVFKNDNVNISSLRLGNIIGDHSVHFGTPGEILTIKHSATSRIIYAHGILKAVRFALQKEKGLFTFSDVIHSDIEYEI